MAQPNEPTIHVVFSLDGEEYHILMVHPNAQVVKIEATVDDMKHHVLIVVPPGWTHAEIVAAARTGLPELPGIGEVVDAVLKQAQQRRSGWLEMPQQYDEMFRPELVAGGRWWLN